MLRERRINNITKNRNSIFIVQKNDPLSLDNYRPITLLNVDTKLIAYTLAQRLKPVLSKIINSDQNGYVKNRYIGFNIRQIQDIIDYSETFNIDGALLFIDFSKAFDSLEWSFMYEALLKFGLPQSFIKWVKTLYNGIKGCILNNGWISETYSIFRGIRQGCPLSSIIFVIAVEILACRIRQDTGIKGFQIKLDSKTHSLKISQLADDTTLFLKSKQEISLALNLIEEFGTLSGLKLNKSKTEGIWLGKLKHSKDKYENISWNKSPIKSLGVYFGTNKIECHKLNTENILRKSEKAISNWKKRKLTMIGRITVIKTLIIPNVTFLASVTNLSRDFLTQFKKLIFNYIWQNKNEKIKRSTLCNDYQDGGLKMIDIDSYITSIYISWVKRLTTEEFSNWKVIPLYYFNKFGANFALFNMNPENIYDIPNLKKIMPEFYFEILKSWYKVHNSSKISKGLNFKCIRQQFIWGNQSIKLNGKSLVFPNWIESDILFINDIIDKQGNISQKVILNKLKEKSNWIAELSKLKSAIKKEWKLMLKSNQSISTKVQIDRNLYLETKNKAKSICIKKLKPKDIYNYIKGIESDTPIGFIKWKKNFNLNSSNQLHDILNFTFHQLIDNKLKMFRWKLINYILPCKQLLYQWKIMKDNQCHICHQVDNYNHFFKECEFLQEFWIKVGSLLDKIKIGTHILSMQNLILGYKIPDSSYFDINVLLTIVLFAVYKSNYASELKHKYIDVYRVFKLEFLEWYETSILLERKCSKFLKETFKYI